MFASDCPFDNKSALLKVLDWHRMGDIPLTDTVKTKFNRAYIMSQTPRRQKLLARVNWYLQSSLKYITE